MQPDAPRIPPRDDRELGPDDLVDAIRQRRGGSLLNLDRMLLNSPALAVGWNTFLGAVRNRLSLDARLRELAICTVAVLTRATYEYSQHAPEFLAAGGNLAQLDALDDVASARHNPLFSTTEQAVIGLAQAMTEQVQVPDDGFRAVQNAIPDVQQQVELVAVIATYNMVARFLEALQVPLERS